MVSGEMENANLGTRYLIISFYKLSQKKDRVQGQEYYKVSIRFNIKKLSLM